MKGNYLVTPFLDEPQEAPDADVLRANIMHAAVSSFEHPLVHHIDWWIRPGVIGAMLFLREPCGQLLCLLPYKGLDLRAWVFGLKEQLKAERCSIHAHWQEMEEGTAAPVVTWHWDTGEGTP